MPQLVRKSSSHRRPTATALLNSVRTMVTIHPDPVYVVLPGACVHQPLHGAPVRTTLPIMPQTTSPLGRGINPRPQQHRIPIRTTILINEKVR